MNSPLRKIVFLLPFVAAYFIIDSCNDQTGNNEKNEKAEMKGASAAVSDSAFLATGGSLAMNDPDKFNWYVFARICHPADSQQQQQSNDVIWETWPDDDATYPQDPDPNHPPVWPPAAFTGKQKKLKSIKQQLLRKQLLMKQTNFRVMIEPGNGGTEEVRRNPTSFNFIIGNGLWYTQGLANAFKQRTMNEGYNPLSFPTGAIEVKGVWKKIPKDSMSYYHWNYDNTGTLYGLIALHIMTKALPNWTWATWEWVGNAGRCDSIGCHDLFGAVPSNVDPNKNPDQGYPPGQMTPELVQLFKDFGVKDEWKNYRLKGSQTNFIDETGRTTLLGNSITEAGFVHTSSCITCHSVASFNAAGDVQPSIGFMPDGQSQNGPTNPANFWSSGVAPYGKLSYLPYDFVWGVVVASPAKK